MEHTATPKINKALEEQAKMLAMLQAAHEEFKIPGQRPWMDLGSINQANKLIAEALGFIHGCEGSNILEEVA